MSTTGVIRLFAASVSRCVCLLPPRVLSPVVLTLAVQPAPRLLSTQPNTKKRKAYPPKKKRPTKRERCLYRPAANTKLSDVNIIESRKASEGGSKQKAITMSTSNFSLESIGVSDECRIQDVVSVGNRDPIEHVGEKILRRGYGIVIDATPFQGKFTVNDLLEGCDVSHVSNSVMIRFQETVGAGSLFARVLSKPGQVGNCNGVVCEGEDLSRLLKTLTLMEAEQSEEYEETAGAL